MDLPTRQDFAVMELLYSGAGRRLDGLMESVFQRVKDKYSDHSLLNWNKENKGRDRRSCAYWGAAICWSWVIINQNPYQYFFWGIQFPEYDSEWGTTEIFPKNGSYPQLVFGYSTTEEKYTKQALDAFLTKGYTVGERTDVESTIFLQSLPISQLLESNYNIDTITDWLSEELDKALTVITDMR
ncbi:hypothetical protein [Vibrio sp. ABG19]|uniref:hypothetical protein n=1 Tax=Vibrio sp. ABG19 TaxID=2817385 RepID=UPI00249DA440|nr:hypothetical protein [Vibrio sp. ABG19]WGY45661.1 hypothetical protein J0X00_02095 [Vibrio sp. ABG19]